MPPGVLVAVIASAVFLGLDTLMLKLTVDDVVAAVPMHLGCGVMGTLFVGFFAREEYVTDFYGVRPGGERNIYNAMHACRSGTAQGTFQACALAQRAKV